MKGKKRTNQINAESVQAKRREEGRRGAAGGRERGEGTRGGSGRMSFRLYMMDNLKVNYLESEESN